MMQFSTLSVLQYTPVSGWGLQKQRSLPPHESTWIEKGVCRVVKLKKRQQFMT